jgi:hypothetical protein
VTRFYEYVLRCTIEAQDRRECGNGLHVTLSSGLPAFDTIETVQVPPQTRTEEAQRELEDRYAALLIMPRL